MRLAFSIEIVVEIVVVSRRQVSVVASVVAMGTWQRRSGWNPGSAFAWRWWDRTHSSHGILHFRHLTCDFDFDMRLRLRLWLNISLILTVWNPSFWLQLMFYSLLGSFWTRCDLVRLRSRFGSIIQKSSLFYCLPNRSDSCRTTFPFVSIVFWHILDHTGYVFGPFFAVGQLFLSLDHLYYNYCIFTLLSLIIESHLIVLMVFKSVDSITAKNIDFPPSFRPHFDLVFETVSIAVALRISQLRHS